ncbi:hypothetical protein [Dactylosporangium sp. CA-092794]|uniref:hypothetical protein n=1 Tax=Dactylosporangium sp. CA-092794 TaxID=3239929 RepID=UPI003D93CD85
MSRTALERSSADFAERLTKLLNSTVTDGASIRTLLIRTGTVVLGAEVQRQARGRSPIRLRTARGLHLWLDVEALLFADDDGHLTVQKSTWALLAGPQAADEVLHYDYERGKDGYPEAYLQVYGHNPSLEELLAAAGRKRSRLHHLHLPVGGRRFRPALEDLIEFLIDERLVEAKADSKLTLERSRTTYHDIQLLAAIRRRPSKSAEGLLDLGYGIKEPAIGGR